MENSKSSLSDEDLALNINSGFDDLFPILFNRYLGIIHNKAAQFFPDGEREDAVQEGLVALYYAVKTFVAGTSSFKTFACLCIERAEISAARKYRAKRLVPEKAIVNSDDVDLGTNNVTPESAVIEKEDFSLLISNIKNVLSAFEYKILSEYLAGNSYEEIAAANSINVKAVNNAMCRVRRKIKAIK